MYTGLSQKVPPVLLTISASTKVARSKVIYSPESESLVTFQVVLLHLSTSPPQSAPLDDSLFSQNLVDALLLPLRQYKHRLEMLVNVTFDDHDSVTTAAARHQGSAPKTPCPAVWMRTGGYSD